MKALIKCRKQEKGIEFLIPNVDITAGSNPIEIKKGIDIATEKIVSYLKEKSTPVNDKEKIKQVATISANNDETMGNLIAEAMEKIGKKGIITVEEAKSIETHLELVEGMQFDKGYLSPYMANDQEKMEGNFENPLILVTDRNITTLKELLPTLETVTQESRPLINTE